MNSTSGSRPLHYLDQLQSHCNIREKLSAGANAELPNDPRQSTDIQIESLYGNSLERHLLDLRGPMPCEVETDLDQADVF